MNTALKLRQRKEHFPTRTDRRDPLMQPGGDRERYFRADSELMGFTVTLRMASADLAPFSLRDPEEADQRHPVKTTGSKLCSPAPKSHPGAPCPAWR